ncbi:Zinc phosphodiesterase ELAC protein 1 [Galdieria sulphuraria]|nr:Zinc phosphodiesterase ELAC protein 1 [Galdieria sulphuraria]
MTLTRLIEAKWHSIYGFRNLKGIFITHLHGDHVWGLPVLMEKIGFYTQHQQRYMRRIKRSATLHIFGPQGLRLFLRTALQNTFLGFWFCVHELIPSDKDFDHVEPWYVPECLLEENQTSATYLPFLDKLPGKHCEEIVGEDVKMDTEEKCWKLYVDELFQVQVLARPIKHRVPCWGYFFKELTQYSSDCHKTARKHFTVSYGINDWDISSIEDKIDTKYAYCLGVRGKQFNMLRNCKAVKVKSRRDPIEFSEVEASMENFANRAVFNEFPVFRPKSVAGMCGNRIPRSILILGDTSDPSNFLNLAKECDVLVHEATFSEALKDKAVESFHSTAKMAGQFATSLEARTLVLTHFSSRYETNFYRSDGIGMNEDLLKSGPNFRDDNDDDTNSVVALSAEASSAYSKGRIYLARDYSTYDLAPHSNKRKSDLRCCLTRNMDKKHSKCKSYKNPVELWLQKPMSRAQWKRLKRNVLHFSKESFELLFNAQQESATSPVNTE